MEFSFFYHVVYGKRTIRKRRKKRPPVEKKLLTERSKESHSSVLAPVLFIISKEKHIQKRKKNQVIFAIILNTNKQKKIHELENDLRKLQTFFLDSYVSNFYSDTPCMLGKNGSSTFGQVFLLIVFHEGQTYNKPDWKMHWGKDLLYTHASAPAEL